MSIKRKSSPQQKISSTSTSLLSISPCANGTMLRGAYDLSESGAGKALVESIQFQLEGK